MNCESGKEKMTSCEKTTLPLKVDLTDATNQQRQLSVIMTRVPPGNYILVPAQNRCSDESGPRKSFMYEDTVITSPPNCTGQIPITGSLPQGLMILNPVSAIYSGNFIIANQQIAANPVHTNQPVIKLQKTGPSDIHKKGLQILNADEVVYVNAKQYKRILIRRQQRYKLQTDGKLLDPSKAERKKYLHESRHLHALKRNRAPGGRFQSKLQPENKSQ